MKTRWGRTTQQTGFCSGLSWGVLRWHVIVYGSLCLQWNVNAVFPLMEERQRHYSQVFHVLLTTRHAGGSPLTLNAILPLWLGGEKSCVISVLTAYLQEGYFSFGSPSLKGMALWEHPRSIRDQKGIGWRWNEAHSCPAEVGREKYPEKPLLLPLLEGTAVASQWMTNISRQHLRCVLFWTRIQYTTGVPAGFLSLYSRDWCQDE